MVCVETSCSRYGARVGITAATSAPWIVCCCCMLPSAPFVQKPYGRELCDKVYIPLIENRHLSPFIHIGYSVNTHLLQSQYFWQRVQRWV
jgi:hypothetical protein